MDKQEFSQRVMALEDRLYRISYGLLRQEQDRKDAVQESVLKAWENLRKLKNEAFFETWLTRILINECHNIQRREGRVRPVEDVPEPTVPEGANPILHDAILALPRERRIVVILHYMEGYDVREIARILKVPEGTVKSRLRRARLDMKDTLTRREEEQV